MASLKDILVALFRALPNIIDSITKFFTAVEPPTPPPAVVHPVDPPHVSRITTWALAIQHAEGGKPQDKNTRNHNPGNLKYGTFTKNLPFTGKDEENFLIFANYTIGFGALCVYLQNACKGLYEPIFTPTMTLDQFTTIYAQPPNANYVNSVANRLGVHITISIGELL